MSEACHERAEVAPSVVPQHDCLDVNERHIRRQAANRLGDCREPIGEVRAASAPDVRQFEPFAGEDAEAVVFHFVQPTGSGGRAIDQNGLTRAHEADRRISSPTGRRGAPRYRFQPISRLPLASIVGSNAAAVMAMRIIAT
jgi:hypothetical protein